MIYKLVCHQDHSRTQLTQHYSFRPNTSGLARPCLRPQTGAGRTSSSVRGRSGASTAARCVTAGRTARTAPTSGTASRWRSRRRRPAGTAAPACCWSGGTASGAGSARTGCTALAPGTPGSSAAPSARRSPTSECALGGGEAARRVGREAQGAVWRVKILTVVRVQMAGGYMNPVSAWSPFNSEQSDVSSLSLDGTTVRLTITKRNNSTDKIK